MCAQNASLQVYKIIVGIISPVFSCVISIFVMAIQKLVDMNM